MLETRPAGLPGLIYKSPSGGHLLKRGKPSFRWGDAAVPSIIIAPDPERYFGCLAQKCIQELRRG